MLATFHSFRGRVACPLHNHFNFPPRHRQRESSNRPTVRPQSSTCKFLEEKATDKNLDNPQRISNQRCEVMSRESSLLPVLDGITLPLFLELGRMHELRDRSILFHAASILISSVALCRPIVAKKISVTLFLYTSLGLALLICQAACRSIR